MDFSAIIGVIIGMVLVYSLLSIIVTQVNSLISVLLKTRASHLRDGIAELVKDPEIQAQVLRHPLLNVVTDEKQNFLLRMITALTGRRKAVTAMNAAQMQAAQNAAETGHSPGPLTAPQLSGVTYVDPKLFTDALVDTLLNNSRNRFYAPLDAAVKPLPQSDEKDKIKEKISAYKVGAITATELSVDASCLSVPDVANALKAAIDKIEPHRVAFEQDVRERDLENVLQGVSQVTDPSTRRALQTLLSSADKIETAEQKLESWFNARMGQVSDAYKRHMQFYTLLIGFIIAAVLNVDTIHLANTLYTSPAVRESVAQVASVFVAQQQSAGTAQAATGGSDDIEVIAAQAASAVNQVANLNLPIGWVFTDADCQSLVGVASPVITVATPTPSPTTTPSPTDVTTGDFPATLDPFATPNPITDAQTVAVATAESTPEASGDGGNGQGATPSTINLEPCTDRRNLALYVPGTQAFNFGNTLLKLIGLLLSMFAIGQGAPFWFDLLNRIVGRGGNSQGAPPVNVSSPVNVTVNPIPQDTPNGGGTSNTG